MTLKKVPIIPMKDFFRNPEKHGFSISPDGSYFAFLQPWKNRLNIHVQKIGDEAVKRITVSEERDIFHYLWANNDRLIYLQDTGGDENFKIYAVDKTGENLVNLTPFDHIKAQIIDELKEDDAHILIALNQRDPMIHDVFRLNVQTGEMHKIAENPGNITSWLTDHDGKLRAAVSTDGVNSSLLYRESEENDFELLITTNFKEAVSPLMFTYNNKYLYVSSNIGRDKSAIVVFDPGQKKEREIIYEHPEVDVSDLYGSDKRKVITAASYTTDKLHYYFFDEQRKKLQKDLESKLPGYEVVVSDHNRDEDKVLVRTYSDKSRGAYFFYDIAKGNFLKLADLSPWLDESWLADMKPISFNARDGQKLYGYLTLPPGHKPEKLSVVVNPHGGPWARDQWGFSPEVQFLANRGYAVLQVNFRASVGYGRKFWEEGFGQWGLKMQEDITDGVKWLIKEGIADPNKIGIYGASYGGYAALAGLTFTPDLYACGIDYVGVSNLFTFIESIPPYWKPYLEMLYEMLGHPEKDKERLQATSPVFHVHQIKAPLLIAQGANDPRVKQAESDQIVKALREKGIEVPYILKENEGHGFANEENRFDFYRAMEIFLAKHLGGSVEV